MGMEMHGVVDERDVVVMGWLAEIDEVEVLVKVSGVEVVMRMDGVSDFI